MQSSQAVQENKDHIINDLNVIAWKMREYRIVPKTLGGGGGEMTGYVISAGLSDTEDAKYAFEAAVPGTKTPTGIAIASIHASSKKYADAAVDVMVDESGNLWNWVYKGPFQ
jgi:hypothetical protein